MPYDRYSNRICIPTGTSAEWELAPGSYIWWGQGWAAGCSLGLLHGGITSLTQQFLGCGTSPMPQSGYLYRTDDRKGLFSLDGLGGGEEDPVSLKDSISLYFSQLANVIASTDYMSASPSDAVVKQIMAQTEQNAAKVAKSAGRKVILFCSFRFHLGKEVDDALTGLVSDTEKATILAFFHWLKTFCIDWRYNPAYILPTTD